MYSTTLQQKQPAQQQMLQADAVMRFDASMDSRLLKWETLGPQSRIGQRVCERRVACEPAVEGEEAGAIAEDERSKDVLINYL